MSALIAGVISAIGVVVGLLAQRARERQWNRDRQRAMTDRLYERRLATYPVAMRLTEPLRGLREFRGDTGELLAAVHRDLNEWHSSQAAFLISKETLQAVYGLRDALSRPVTHPNRFTPEEMTRLFKAKNKLRWCLRNDIRLLFGEDSEEERPEE